MSENKYKRVYKYMKIEYIIDSIKNGIYAGAANSFNDPYEEKDIRYIEQYRICCLASSSNKMLMWAHYGNHQQCCVEFSVREDSVRSVEYSEDYNITRNLIEQASEEMFFRKAKEWSYEKEQRAVCDIKKFDDALWKKVQDRYYLRALPKTVYFGLRVNFENEDIQAVLNYIKEHNLSNIDNQIEVKLCALRDDKYEITTDKQFDYTREIR